METDGSKLIRLRRELDELIYEENEAKFIDLAYKIDALEQKIASQVNN